MGFLVAAVGAIVGAIGSVVTGIIGAAGSFLTGLGAFGKALIGIGLNVAASYIQKQMRPDFKQPPGGSKFEKEYGELVSRHVACGLVGVAGHDVYFNSYGDSNKFAQHLFVLSDYPCTELTRVAINGEWVSLDTANPDADKGFPVISGEQANLIWVKFVDGHQTAADDYLIDNANPSTRWDEDYIGVGICYVIVSMTYDREKNAQFPDMFFEFKGAKLYDPRKDSTQPGGSGTHRWGDPSTHEYSENPIVMDYNYRRGFSINGDLFCGMGMPESDLPLDKYFAAMNLCDETVSGRARYRCSILLGAGPDTKFGDNIDALMLSCGGMVIDGVDGSWPLVGSDQPIVATFTDADIVTSEPVNYRAKQSMSELVNSVSGNYPDPEQLWSMVGYEEQTNAAYVAVDRRTRDISIDFPQVPDNAQAESLASIYLKENRYEIKASLTLRPRFQVLEPGDWVTWGSDRYGSHTFMVTDAALRSLESDGPRNAQISLQQRDGSIYDAVTPSVPNIPIGPGAPILATELVNFQVVGLIVTGEDDRKAPAIYATWNPITDETVTGGIIRYWPTSQPTAVLTKTFEADDTYSVINEGVVGETEYSVDAKIFTDPLRTTVFGATKTLTTPSQSIVSGDILDGAIISDKLADAAVTGSKIADEAIAATKFASGIEPVTIVDSATLPTTKITENINWEGALYTWNGTAYVKPDVEIGPGSITATEIADGAISTPKLAANAVTADKIAANTITAAQIAAGAVNTSELAAGAVTTNILASGSIVTEKLAVGNGKNLIPDPLLKSGTDKWLINDQTGGAWGAWAWGKWTNLAYGGAFGTLFISQPNTINTGYAQIYCAPNGGYSGPLSISIPASAGKTYEFSAYMQSPRCESRLFITWLDSSGTALSTSQSSAITSQSGNPNDPDSWNRFVVRGVAPAGTAAVQLFIRKYGTLTTPNSYMFAYKPQFCECPPNATEITPWSDGNTTLITTNGIVTGAVTADKITVANLAALGITVGSADIQNAAITSSKTNGLIIT